MARRINVIGEAKQGKEQPHTNTGETPVNADGATLPVVATRAQPLKNTDNGDSAENRRLSRKEQAVLRAITDPTLSTATNTVRAKAAGVSERHFYQIIADPFFARVHRRVLLGAVQANASRIIEKAVDVATSTGRDGATDRWKLLEMSGHYTPRQQTDITSAGQPIVGIVGVAVDDV
jgi:hypothetical protein